eukprot:UN02246
MYVFLTEPSVFLLTVGYHGRFLDYILTRCILSLHSIEEGEITKKSLIIFWSISFCIFSFYLTFSHIILSLHSFSIYIYFTHAIASECYPYFEIREQLSFLLLPFCCQQTIISFIYSLFLFFWTSHYHPTALFGFVLIINIH